jgi:hypothetical protein
LAIFVLSFFSDARTITEVIFFPFHRLHSGRVLLGGMYPRRLFIFPPSSRIFHLHHLSSIFHRHTTTHRFLTHLLEVIFLERSFGLLYSFFGFGYFCDVYFFVYTIPTFHSLTAPLISFLSCNEGGLRREGSFQVYYHPGIMVLHSFRTPSLSTRRPRRRFVVVVDIVLFILPDRLLQPDFNPLGSDFFPASPSSPFPSAFTTNHHPSLSAYLSPVFFI